MQARNAPDLVGGAGHPIDAEQDCHRQARRDAGLQSPPPGTVKPATQEPPRTGHGYRGPRPAGRVRVDVRRSNDAW